MVRLAIFRAMVRNLLLTVLFGLSNTEAGLQSASNPACLPLPPAGFLETAGVEEQDFVLPSNCPLPGHVDMSPFFPIAGDQEHQASCTAWASDHGLASFRQNWESNTRPNKALLPNETDIYSPGFLFNMVKQMVNGCRTSLAARTSRSRAYPGACRVSKEEAGSPRARPRHQRRAAEGRSPQHRAPLPIGPPRNAP